MATDEIGLAIESLSSSIDWKVSAIGLQLARFRVVTQIGIEQHVS
jgi:hypothetical protein